LLQLREGLNENINTPAGISHGGLSPPPPFCGKLLRKFPSFEKRHQLVLNALEHVLFDTRNSKKNSSKAHRIFYACVLNLKRYPERCMGGYGGSQLDKYLY
jgi:hypothetical protein